MCPTLLIVDDHAGFRAFARLLLQAEGFDVIGEAHDARSAVDEVARLHPDIVLMDVALPDGDGFDASKAIVRAHGASVVLTSSRNIAGLDHRLGQSLALGFIPKGDLSGSAIRAMTDER